MCCGPFPRELSVFSLSHASSNWIDGTNSPSTCTNVFALVQTYLLWILYAELHTSATPATNNRALSIGATSRTENLVQWPTMTGQHNVRQNACGQGEKKENNLLLLRTSLAVAVQAQVVSWHLALAHRHFSQRIGRFCESEAGMKVSCKPRSDLLLAADRPEPTHRCSGVEFDSSSLVGVPDEKALPQGLAALDLQTFMTCFDRYCCLNEICDFKCLRRSVISPISASRQATRGLAFLRLDASSAMMKLLSCLYIHYAKINHQYARNLVIEVEMREGSPCIVAVSVTTPKLWPVRKYSPRSTVDWYRLFEQNSQCIRRAVCI